MTKVMLMKRFKLTEQKYRTLLRKYRTNKYIAELLSLREEAVREWKQAGGR